MHFDNGILPIIVVRVAGNPETKSGGCKTKIAGISLFFFLVSWSERKR